MRVRVAVAVALVGACCAGCGRGLRGVAVREAARDSAGVRVRVAERWRVDTVWVAVAATRDSVAGARDTVSRLENAWGVSYCAVGRDGSLTHSLRSKGGRVAALSPVVVERARDSVVWRDREVVVEVPVAVARELTGWERAAVGAFPWLLAVCVLLLSRVVWRVCRWVRLL